MARQLPNEILMDIVRLVKRKHKFSGLYNFLFVNHQWCSVAVSIMWENSIADIWYDGKTASQHSQFVDTLVKCLSREAKKGLQQNDICLTGHSWETPAFLYISMIQSF